MTIAWKTSVRMTSATTERLATRARNAGRTSRFSSEMNTTAMRPPPSSVIWSRPGSSHAVMLKAMTPATSATIARLSERRAAESPMPQQRDLRLVEVTQSADRAHIHLLLGSLGSGCVPHSMPRDPCRAMCRISERASPAIAVEARCYFPRRHQPGSTSRRRPGRSLISVGCTAATRRPGSDAGAHGGSDQRHACAILPPS